MTDQHPRESVKEKEVIHLYSLLSFQILRMTGVRNMAISIILVFHEWYFLCQYAMLKAVPNKNAGFIILFTSVMIYFYLYFLSLFYFTVVINIFSFSFNYVSYWFSSLLSFVWIGGQFPQDNFLSYGRILTLYYYFLLICISFYLISLLYSGQILDVIFSFVFP